VVRASDSQCRSRNCSGFDPSILPHSGINTYLRIAYCNWSVRFCCNVIDPDDLTKGFTVLGWSDPDLGPFPTFLLSRLFLNLRVVIV